MRVVKLKLFDFNVDFLSSCFEEGVMNVITLRL